MTDTDLSFLIASRICHDLINPIGAIHNGLELMTLSQSTAQGIEFDLVQASANDARARVEFFRLAFGSQKHGVLLQSDALKKLCAPLFTQPRYTVNWSLPAALDRTEAQRLVLALLCFEKQLPQGGHIWISPTHLRAVPVAPRAIVEQWGYVSGPHAGKSPAASDIQFVLLQRLTQAAGLRPELRLSEDSFELSFSRV